MKIFISLVSIAGLLLAGCTLPAAQQQRSESGGATMRISRADFGERWPFTVDEGVLECRGAGSLGALTFTANGVTYAVNGVAKRSASYSDLSAIIKDNPLLPGTKMDVSPILARGAGLCM